MTDEATHVSDPDRDERDSRASRIVEDAAVRRAAGERISDADLLAAHPNLRPALDRRLAALRAVERALNAVSPDASPATQVMSDGPRTYTSVALASAADEDALPPPGTYSFPGYDVVRAISRGGQGVVYEARQHGTKRTVAIKVLLQGPHASPAARKRFEREIELVAQLDHPNIIKVLHAGATADGHDFYVMDYVAGQSLRDWVRQRKPPLEDVLKLFETICEAVQFAHQRGVIHRDLKPSNILVDESGTPHLLDFGLARDSAHPNQTALTLTDQVLGTLPYMSPEQAAGDSTHVDTRTDVYALGVVLYELLTGAYPYPVAGRLLEVLRHIAETPPAPPTSVWDRTEGVSRRARDRVAPRSCPIDNEIETIVLKALAKEPQRRYQSVGELARDVQHYLHGDPIDAKRDSAWYVLRKLARQNVRATVVLLSMVALVISAAVICFFSWRQSQNELKKREARDALLERENAHYAKLAGDAQRWQLGWFLLEWHAGREDAAAWIRDTLPPVNSPERAVMDFLLDSNDSFARLQSRLGPQRPAMLHFALAERAWKAGRREEAFTNYQKALETVGEDRLLRPVLEARLRNFPPETRSAPP